MDISNRVETSQEMPVLFWPYNNVHGMGEQKSSAISSLRKNMVMENKVSFWSLNLMYQQIWLKWNQSCQILLHRHKRNRATRSGLNRKTSLEFSSMEVLDYTWSDLASSKLDSCEKWNEVWKIYEVLFSSYWSDQQGTKNLNPITGIQQTTKFTKHGSSSIL